MPNYNVQTDPTAPVRFTTESDTVSGIFTVVNASEIHAWVKHSPQATPALPATVAECLSGGWFPIGTFSAPVQLQLGSGNPVDVAGLWVIEEPDSAGRANVCAIGV